MDNEPTETGIQFSLDLRKPQEAFLGERFVVDGKQLGVSSWEEMLQETQKDLHERGISVSSFLGRLKTSAMVKGDEHGFSSDARQVTPGAIANFFFGQDVSIIHTHPMGEDLEHLRTTAISDGDIQNFNSSTYNAFVALDRGGAHLLLRRGATFEKTDIPRDLAKNIREDLEEKNGSVRDLIQRLAGELEKYGISYYFCPDVSSTRAKNFQSAKTYFKE